MTASDTQLLRLAARGTSGSTVLAVALSLALLCAQHARVDVGLDGHRFQQKEHTPGTHWLRSSEVDELGLAKQISRVYEELLTSQREMEHEIREALYDNLSDLYT